jgi:tight adherence protein C
MFVSDQNIPLLIAALAFVVICLLSLGILIFLRGLRDRRVLIAKIRSEDRDADMIEEDARSLEFSGGSGNTFVKFLGAIGAKTTSAKTGKPTDATDLKLKFLRAGLRGSNVPTVFWGTKILLAVCLPMAFLVTSIVLIKAMQTNHMLLGTMFFALLGLILPDLWLRSRISKRKEKLVRAFPDALDLLVVCVEAGMGLDAAINRVGVELALNHPDLSRELNLLNLELRAGKPRQTALRNLAQRTDIDDVHSLVTLLIQTDRFGTSVAKALKVYADTFRTTRFQRAEEFAAKLATKLIFPLAFCIFPSFFVVALGPVAVQLYRMFFKG